MWTLTTLSLVRAPTGGSRRSPTPRTRRKQHREAGPIPEKLRYRGVRGQFLAKNRQPPYPGFMSGMFNDVATLRSDADGEERSGAPVRVPLTVVEPEGHSRGGIVLLHESREFTGYLLEFMRTLSDEGWTVVAPDLFHRAGTAGKEVFGQD